MTSLKSHVNYGFNTSREEWTDEWPFYLDLLGRFWLDKRYTDFHYQPAFQWWANLERIMSNTLQCENAWKDKVVIWHERTFELDLMVKDPDSLLQLSLSACGYQTTVWIDSLLLSALEREQEKIEEYTFLWNRLDEENFCAKNRLTVRIMRVLDAFIFCSKQECHLHTMGTKLGVRKTEFRGLAWFLIKNKKYLDGILYRSGIPFGVWIGNHMYEMGALWCNIVVICIADIYLIMHVAYQKFLMVVAYGWQHISFECRLK